jgi:hypothetical protein
MKSKGNKTNKLAVSFALTAPRASLRWWGWECISLGATDTFLAAPKWSPNAVPRGLARARGGFVTCAQVRSRHLGVGGHGPLAPKTGPKPALLPEKRPRPKPQPSHASKVVVCTPRFSMTDGAPRSGIFFKGGSRRGRTSKCRQA